MVRPDARNPNLQEISPMRTFTAAALALGLAFGLQAHAADAPAAKNPQQSKMATCNKDAGDKKGDDRKKFMSECLKAKPEPMTQQDRMKSCNKDADGKKGDDRKKFMSECLKAKPA
jgi:hypothetical protein